MITNNALYLGRITTFIFIIGTILFGYFLQDYNQVSQTVSEIGREGSLFYKQWQVFSIGVGCLIILYAVGVVSFSRKNGLSIVPAILLSFYGISQFFIGVYPSPHPLHNVFGLSMLIGYLSPLAFFLFWKNQLGKRFKKLSLLIFIIITLAIFLNLSPMFIPKLYPLEFYGIIQRLLLFTFYIYFFVVSFYTIKFLKAKNDNNVFL